MNSTVDKYNIGYVMIIKKSLNKYKNLSIPIRASICYLFCSFLQRGILLITTPIFTRLMDTDEYGQFGVFNSWLSIITVIVSLNMFYGIHAQGLVKFSEECEKFSSSLQGLTTIMVIVWSFIYIAFHNYWNKLLSLTTFQMISLLLIVWLTSIFNFWANEQRVKYSYKALVIVSLLVSIAEPVLEIILIQHFKDKVTARIIGWLFVELVAYSWMYIIQLKRGRVFFSIKYWIYALTISLPLVPHYLSATVLNSADRIMIEKMVGDSEAGIYSLAYSVALIMTLFNTALMQTLNPWIYQKIKEKKEKEIAPVAYITLILIAVVNLLLILLAPEVVAIFAPQKYYQAIWVIPPVAMSVYFMYSYDLFAKFAFYYEKTFIIMIASVSGAILNILLNYIFIKEFGYIAAGYTTLVCYIVFVVFHYVFMLKICRKYCDCANPYEIKKIIGITIPFLGISFLLLATYNVPSLRYGIFVIVIIFSIIKRKKLIKIIKKILITRKN